MSHTLQNAGHATGIKGITLGLVRSVTFPRLRIVIGSLAQAKRGSTDRDNTIRPPVQPGARHVLCKRDQLILSAAKAILLVAALVVFFTIAICAGLRSASRRLASPRRSRR